MATTITANGINFPDGSAGSPSIGGTDTNTGLFTGSDIVGFATGGNERLRIDASGNVNIANDSGQLRLGTDADLLVYHNGSDSYVKNSTGDLYIRDTNGNIFIQPKTDENAIKCVADGAVELYHNNLKKFETTSYGGIFGNESTSAVASPVRLSLGGTFHSSVGGDPKLSVWTDGSNHMGFGVSSDQLDVILTNNAYDLVVCGGNNGTDERFRVHGDGTGIQLPDSSKALFGDNNDLQLYHNGSNSYIVQNGTGELYIRDADNSTAVVIESTHGNSVYQKFSHTGHDNNFIGYEDDHFVVYTKNSGADSHSVRINVDQSGLAFHGDTAAANRLNDYEEGTFSPFTSTQISDHNITIPAQAHYVKVGRICHVWWRMTYSSSSGTQISGNLPFTSSNPTENASYSPFFMPLFPKGSGASDMGFCYTGGDGSTGFYFYRNNANYASYSFNAGTGEFTVSGSYRTT